MIRVFIVEDEAPARERLRAFVEAHPDLKLLGWAETGQEAIEAINRLHPDLVFLDVRLPDMLGLDILKVVEETPAVIFSTAYDAYAVEAFEQNAVDYLLKPFSHERFNRAVQRAIARLKSRSHTFVPHSVLGTAQGNFQRLVRIPAKIGERIFLLPVEKIVYFSSENKVILAHLVDRSFIINYTLDELEKRLDPELFFRIHRSTIVNLNFVRTIEPYFGGGYIATVNDQKKTQLPISRNAARRLREKLGW